MTSHLMFSSHIYEFRDFLPADVRSIRAPRMEPTARWRVDWAGHLPLQYLVLASAPGIWD